MKTEITEIRLKGEGKKLDSYDLELIKRIEKLRRAVLSYRKPVYLNGHIEYHFDRRLEIVLTGDVYTLGCMLEGFEGVDEKGEPTVFGVPFRIITSDAPEIYLSCEII